MTKALRPLRREAPNPTSPARHCHALLRQPATACRLGTALDLFQPCVTRNQAVLVLRCARFSQFRRHGLADAASLNLGGKKVDLQTGWSATSYKASVAWRDRSQPTTTKISSAKISKWLAARCAATDDWGSDRRVSGDPRTSR